MKRTKRGNLITIGSFDGVHRGHQALLDRAVIEAKKRGLKSLALTFTVPPKMVLDPRLHSRILSDTDEKGVLLEERGIDKVVVLNFDRVLASLRPFSFFRSMLLEQFEAKGIVIGADFRFGSDRSAGAIELVRWGLEYEIPIWVIPPVRYQKQVVSSSLIRHLLETNHYKKAVGFLGHPYIVHGRVAPGRGVGTKIGFPTANVSVVPGKILPRGVYAVRGWVVGGKTQIFKGVCNIGVRPTLLKHSPIVAEVHVLSGENKLAGQEIFVQLLHRLRSEKKFSGPRALKRAISNDINRSLAFFKRNNL